MSFAHALAVALGGAGGALARYGAGFALTALHGGAPAWSIMAVNVSGSVGLGLAAALMQGRTGAVPALVMVGFFGAFTTFSTFAMDAIALFKDKSLMVSALYVTGSVALSIGGAVLGLALGQFLGKTLS